MRTLPAYSIKKALPALLLCTSLLSCGKSVNLGNPEGPAPTPPNTDPTAQNSEPTTPIIPGTPIACGPNNMGTWDFQQPEPTLRRVVDLLFVVDTSGSMAPKLAGIADTIPEFVSHLAPGTDYRIAVMLAHGHSSYYSGKLYATSGVPLVLDSTHMSVSKIQSYLRKDLRDVTTDSGDANGEAGMVSLMASLEATNFARIQSQGFYRPLAALSVVFVADENDICFPPERNGYTTFPDYVPSRSGLEESAFNQECKKAGQTASNFPDIVYARLRKLQGSRPLTLGAVVHLDPLKVPRSSTLEDAIGHGLIEVVHKSANGVLIEITDSSYAEGLGRLGSVVQSTLNIQTHFTLSGTQSIQASSIRVSVDGQAVMALFDASSRTVEVALKDAGVSRSQVQVRACFNSAGPSAELSLQGLQDAQE